MKTKFSYNIFLDFLILLLFNFTNSYQITDIQPINTAISRFELVSVLNPKNAVNVGTNSNKAVMKMVIPIIKGTKLFLYFNVVKIEK